VTESSLETMILMQYVVITLVGPAGHRNESTETMSHEHA